MADATPLEGGCLCGAVRYRIDGPVTHVAHCHCAMCRRASGAPVVTWVTVARAHLRWLADAPAACRSSAWAERRFCARCGTPLTFASDRLPEEIDVTLGSLDRPDAVRPDRHVWVSARLPWLHLDPDLPEFEENSV